MDVSPIFVETNNKLLDGIMRLGYKTVKYEDTVYTVYAEGI